MKLVRFSVERFRSIIKRSSFSIFDKTVLIGPNNEGKSNILLALVCALRTLEAIAADPDGVKLKQGKTFVFDAVPRTYLYDWKRDYPRSLQDIPGKTENKKSSFAVDFELNKSEFNAFKKLTGTGLSKPIIPLRIEFSPNDIVFTLNIPGHFYKKATKEKMFNIALFITQKIYICHIPAVRTASTAYERIENLLQVGIRQIERSENYQKTAKKLEEVFQPCFDNISNQVQESLQRFLSNSIQTDITFQNKTRYYHDRFLRFNVEVDDGEKTSLAQKGSGIQSLVALSLAHYISSSSRKTDNLILAIDEPEAHLHPDAIHKIRKILEDISNKNQLIIATHSPLLTETTDPHKNIIVKANTAVEATKISEIRNVLGVNPADNLSSAELVLIVEGAADENMLPHLMGLQSDTIKSALEQRRLKVSSCGGTDNMENYVRFMRYQLCNLHVFVDDDESGRQTIDNMKRNGNIAESEFNLLRMRGLSNSEIENMLDPELYADAIVNQYSVSKDKILAIKDSSAKWSDFMEQLFIEEGKTWEENNTIFSLKTIVSQAVKKCNELKLIEHRSRAFIAGCQQLERKLKHEE